MPTPSSHAETPRSPFSAYRLQRRLTEWRHLFARENLLRDTSNAMRTAAVVLPTALAVALACGVPVSLGLTAVVVGGTVAALVGSTPFVIVAPVAFLALLVGGTHDTFGMPGVISIALCCGALQVLFGALNVGHWLRAVPAPVVGGFTAGVGATVMVAQAPHLLGLPVPDSKHLLDVLTHALEFLEHVKPKEALVAAIALGSAVALPRWMPHWPGRFIALLLATGAAQLMHLQVETLHTLPTLLPAPRILDFPRNDVFDLVSSAFLLFVVASVQSSLATDTMTRKLRVDRRDNNGDLVGLGLANIACGLFGTMPVATGQSLTEFHTATGVRSRRSTLMTAIFVGAAALLAPQWIGLVPVSAVAAILVLVAARLVDIDGFRETLAGSRADAAIYTLTFFLVLLVDLFAGAQVGVVAALAVVAVRLGKLDVLLFSAAKRGPFRIRVDGAITFLSVDRIVQIRSQLSALDKNRGIILEMGEVPLIDGAGAEAFQRVVGDLLDRGWPIALLGLNGDCRRQLESVDPQARLAKLFAATEADAQEMMPSKTSEGAYDRLSIGVETFRSRQSGKFEALFDELAEGQRPHTLFMTCADSRIQPNLITSTNPGELFLVRNVGNLVPPYVADDTSPAEYAAIEYGILALGISQIVVCGHSSCGAMKAIIGGNVPASLDSVRRWIQSSFHPDELQELRKAKTPEEAAQRNAAIQLEHLAKHPLVQERLKDGSLRITAWFYDIGGGEILEYDRTDHTFHPLGRKPT